MNIVIFLIMLILATVIDLIRMRYGDWKFPHLFYSRYESGLGIIFAIMLAYYLFMQENGSEILKAIKMIAFVAIYSIVYMFCYYWLNKKRWEPDAKKVEEEKRREYLLHSSFVIKDIIKLDYMGEKTPADEIRYTIVLEDENGNEKRIRTMDPTYYERKMLNGEKVQIGKKRMYKRYE